MYASVLFIGVALLSTAYIFKSVKSGSLPVNDSFFWLIGSTAILLLAIFPKTIDIMARYVGIDYSPSLLFVLCIMFLLLINMRMSKQISLQQIRIVSLAQEIAIIKMELKKWVKK